MVNLTPFLLFDGRRAEAMTFYRARIGGARRCQPGTPAFCQRPRRPV